jgi:hypothetical protein
MPPLFSNVVSRIAISLGVVFLVTSVIGAIQNFSPVPFWDMWPGYLDFYVRVSNGDMAAWWAQHNEHRIVISRLLFWFDFQFLNGTTWFLIVMNYLIALASWMTLRNIAQSVLPGDKLATSRILFSGVSLALLFSWIQKDNFTWGFQSQMFAGILFPMLAFVLFYRAEITTDRRSTLYFVGSLAAGTIAAGTMMNGLVVLPIMVILGMLLRASKARLSLIAALAIIVSIVYLRNFTHSGSFFQSLLAQPMDVLTFFLAYIGAPAHYIFHDGLSASVITGSIIVLGLSWFTVTVIRRPIENRAVYVVLAILLYLTLTCLAVAGSRISWGVEYAFTSRYMTSVLTLWGAMILLLLNSCSLKSRSYRMLVLASIVAIPAALLPVQVQALRKDNNALTDRMVAALALELGVRDEEQIKKIFPWNDRGPDYQWMDWALSLVKVPIARNLSIFDNSLIRDAAKSLGTFNQHHGIECVGDIEAINQIPGDPRFNRLSLWFMDPYTGHTPGAFYVLNSERKVIGYGVSGYARYGLAEDGKARNAGAAAYILSDALDEKMILKGRDINCEVTVSRPIEGQFTPVSLSDPKNWTNGVAKNWGPAVLFKSTPSTRQEIQVHRRLKFADGTVRTILKVEERDELVIVYVDGDHLDGNLAGFPKKITVVPQSRQ